MKRIVLEFQIEVYSELDVIMLQRLGHKAEIGNVAKVSYALTDVGEKGFTQAKEVMYLFNRGTHITQARLELEPTIKGDGQ